MTVFFERAAFGVNLAGGVLLLGATLVAMVEISVLVLSAILNRPVLRVFPIPHVTSLDGVRYNLGKIVIFGLELLVSADVIDTLTKPAHAYEIESLYKIGLVVLIRTILSYFLGKEVEELSKRVEEKRF